MSERFYDAAIWRNIPQGSPACLYADGRFAAPHTAVQALGLTAVRWITVTGNYQTSGCADWLPDNSFDLARYVAGRQQMSVRARLYVARAFARQALDALGYPRAGRLWTYPGLVWWIPTLDNVRATPDELADELRSVWHAPIPARDIWAQQYGQEPELGKRARYDVSQLFGEW